MAMGNKNQHNKGYANKLKIQLSDKEHRPTLQSELYALFESAAAP